MDIKKVIKNDDRSSPTCMYLKYVKSFQYGEIECISEVTIHQGTEINSEREMALASRELTTSALLTRLTTRMIISNSVPCRGTVL